MVFPFRSSRFHPSSGDIADGLSVSAKWKDFILANWHLGVTSFGGPGVHFQIFHTKFVERLKWIDEQVYQELFALCQASPGPASTKMLFCINSIKGGFLSGTLSFFIWSLPGALGMYGLALGVANIGDKMPSPVYALLSGLNAATVGIIALAAVQLSEKAITDQFSRALVFLGGAVGMLYSALWYFPVLMAAAGISTIVWDFRWLHNFFKRFRRAKPSDAEGDRQDGSQAPTTISETAIVGDRVASGSQTSEPSELRRRDGDAILPVSRNSTQASVKSEPSPSEVSTDVSKILTWRRGALVIGAFFATFIVILVLRGTLSAPPLGYSVFANLYLAGTIIFGGGPVVIPLLREYIVEEGWVSGRDFLLGLAIIQAFPGPNFNFAVYLGALAVKTSQMPPEVGALIGFLGMFAPGMVLAAGMMGLWKEMRKRRWVVSLLRGINAAAVGLVYTAVYRLFQMGYLDETHSNGSSLGIDPFWVAITVTSFVGGKWYGLEPVFAILLGGALGMIWYAIVEV